MALPVKIASCFGVLEYWSTGVLECWQKRKPSFQLELVFFITPLLHHSRRLPQGGKSIEAPQEAAQSRVLWAGFFTFIVRVESSTEYLISTVVLYL
jgi:hypothetical protein